MHEVIALECPQAAVIAPGARLVRLRIDLAQAQATAQGVAQ